MEALAVAMVRGAYEYQGQKCSAASRAYIPDTLWPEVRDRVVAMIGDIRMGDVADFRNFMGAVIDRKRLRPAPGLPRAGQEGSAASRSSPAAGPTTRSGWFVEPTLLQVDDPGVPHDVRGDLRPGADGLRVPGGQVGGDARRWWTGPDPTRSPARSSPRIARALVEADRALRYAAGNYYVNDKPTGAVVGQQPFGGGRASGTNDKAGSILNLLRWVSPRAIKETFAPPTDYRYPFMAEA